MSQRPAADYPIPEGSTSGTDLARLLERTEAARSSNDAGTSRPAYLTAGGIWTDTTGGVPKLKLFDGSNDIDLGATGGGLATFDPAATYAVGDILVYQGDLYKATNGHNGAWNAANFAQLSVPLGTIEGQTLAWDAATERWIADTKITILPSGRVGIANPAPDVPFEVGQANDGAGNVIRVSGANAEVQIRAPGDAGFMITQSAPAFSQRWGWTYTASTDRWSLSSKNEPNQMRVQDGKLSINYAGIIYGLVVNGQIASTASTSVINISDRDVKKQIKPLKHSLNIINAIDPVTFRFIKDDGVVGDDGTVYRPPMEYPKMRDVGFIAQDVDEALLGYNEVRKRVIHKTKLPPTLDEDGVELEPEIERYMIDTSKLIPPLVGAVKELTAMVKALTARVEALENP